MKTNSKFLGLAGGLCIALLLFACEKDEITGSIPEPEDGVGLKGFNNGELKSYSNATVLAWNEAISKAVDNKMPPPAESKIYVMVSLAMHDALNNVVPKYETYALDNSEVIPSGITKANITHIADAAVSQAAYEVLVQLFPPAQTAAAELLELRLMGIEDPECKEKGLSIGHEAAAALLAKRQNDVPLGFSSYDQGTDPGTHQSNYMPWAVANSPVWPDHAVYAANMASLQPFGMTAANQFRAAPPYSVNSPEYTADYEEVKRLGCTACPERTAEQTEIGAFWVENLSSSINRIARHLLGKKKQDGWETARLFALIHIAQMDANIGSFEGKYYYNFWRPITAVRGGDSDSNDATAGDASWTPTFPTPPTPDYPSTHAYTGGAGSEMLKLYFGKGPVSIPVSSPYYLPGVQRTMTSYEQIGHESALSRIYIGYHFRKAVEEGEVKGRQIGAYIFKNSLKELSKRNN